MSGLRATAALWMTLDDDLCFVMDYCEDIILL